MDSRNHLAIQVKTMTALPTDAIEACLDGHGGWSGTPRETQRIKAENQLQAFVDENRRLNGERDMLYDALEDAKHKIEDWGAYAPEYFQKKWNLAGDIQFIEGVLNTYPTERAERKTP